jgi:hypothetical protein
MAKNVLSYYLSEPLNSVTIANIDINAGDGDLTIDRLTSGEQMLASGTLQYFEKQGLPTRTLVASNDQATLTLRGSRDVRPRFRLPWVACNGATEWLIHLNPTVSSDIKAHSDGGNLKLNLAGMIITRVSADTGGGNIDIVLPDNTANLSVNAKTGAGNVVVSIPSWVEAHIHATTGLGKTIVDPQFSQIDKNTYQSPGFDTAANKVDITVHSGAGNVSVNTRRKT